MNLNQKAVDQIIQHLEVALNPYLIVVFGSALTTKMRPESDIDIAFLSKSKFSPYEIFMVAQDLAGILGREIDLIDLSTVSTVFQAQVVTTGQVIYCIDETKRMIFEMVTLKKYARLNEEREEIITQLFGKGMYRNG